MPQKTEPKAQSSLEYLVTYGWALIVIATIIGILIFAGGGGINTNTCTTFLQMLCKGVDADGDTLVLVLQNATGQKITINPFTGIAFGGVSGYAVLIYNGQEYRFEDVTINQGDEVTLKGKGMARANSISITYTESRTGLTQTITSNISTDAPPNIEISNNGIDDDGDGDIDCADDQVSDCEYLAQPTTTSELDPCTDNCSITFGSVKTSTAADIEENWAMPSTTLVVYISTYTGPAAAHASYVGEDGPSTPVTQGWNEFPITLPPAFYSTGDDVGPLTLTLDSGIGSTFTALRDADHKPKLLVNLDR